jgi:hypothetical protein
MKSLALFKPFMVQNLLYGEPLLLISYKHVPIKILSLLRNISPSLSIENYIRV